MAPKVCILGAGLMGSGVGARLNEHGVEVTTVLEGRSAASRARAERAGMRDVSLRESFDADFVLSILPPADAVAAAKTYALAAEAAGRRPIFVDCNAVSPYTLASIAAAVAGAGLPFVDACIIGGPPRPGERGPAWYAAGDHARDLLILGQHGLRMSVLDGPIGTASAFKMCYGGMLKGVTAIGSAMILTADRAGITSALHSEIADSMPEILAFLEAVLPNMPSRTARWVAEMQEVSTFVGAPRSEAAAYAAIASFYARLADDYAHDGKELAAIAGFLDKPAT